VGLILYIHQSNIDEDKKREQYKILLSNELAQIDVLLNVAGDYVVVFEGMDSSLSVKNKYLSSFVIEDAGRSGLFPESWSWNLLGLANDIRNHNMFLNHFLSLSTNSQVNKNVLNRIHESVKRLNTYGKNIDSLCEIIKKQMALPEATMRSLYPSGDSLK
jgi:hypothetical protein